MKFSNGKFFYSLKPQTLGNNYEKFFFDTKTGYCEYYAGTFAILARMGGIPSRIVSGYYGGTYNQIGNFYTFKQQDAHSWVEVYLKGNWVRFDPTISVPEQNIINSNNLNFENDEKKQNNETFDENLSLNKFTIYFDYANYLWTNSFLKYDEKSRARFIREKLYNNKNIEIISIFITLFFIFCSCLLLLKLFL